MVLNAGNDASKFTIDSTTGALVFDSAPDYENPTDVGDTAGNNTYVVSVRATDSSGNTADQAVTITVTDADEEEVAPRHLQGPQAPLVTRLQPHPSKKIQPLFTLLSPQTNRSHGHSNAGNDASKFTIDSTTGALVFDSAPDYETPTDVGDTAGNNTYVVSVRATDSSGNTADPAVTITVTDADEVAPNITGPSGSAGDVHLQPNHRKYNRCSCFLHKTDRAWSLNAGNDALNSPLIPQPALWSLIPLPITKIQPT